MAAGEHIYATRFSKYFLRTRLFLFSSPPTALCRLNSYHFVYAMPLISMNSGLRRVKNQIAKRMTMQQHLVAVGWKRQQTLCQMPRLTLTKYRLILSMRSNGNERSADSETGHQSYDDLLSQNQYYEKIPNSYQNRVNRFSSVACAFRRKDRLTLEFIEAHLHFSFSNIRQAKNKDVNNTTTGLIIVSSHNNLLKDKDDFK